MDASAREKELINVIKALRSYLCDLKYEGSALTDRVKAEEKFCLECYKSIVTCNCDESESCVISGGSSWSEESS